MGELTAEQHETLRLHFYEGYTLAEIGEKLGKSPGNCAASLLSGDRKNSASKCAKANCRIANWYGTYWG